MWCGHTREPCCIRFLRLLYQISTNFATSNNTNVLLFHSSVSQKSSAGFARLNPRCLQAVSPSGSSQGEAISCSFSCWLLTEGRSQFLEIPAFCGLWPLPPSSKASHSRSFSHCNPLAYPPAFVFLLRMSD